MGTKPTHAEGYCLMKYRGEKTGRIEWIWNSRDGVTPFCCGSPDGDEMMSHVDWGEDVRIPNYIPAVGSRVFMNHTPESAGTALREREKAIGQPVPTTHWQAVFDEILRGPRVAVVDQTLQDQFRLRAERGGAL